MERCPTCGAAVRPGARFCTSCGSRIDEQAPGTTTEAQDTIVATPAAPADDKVTPEPDWAAASGGAVKDETGHSLADEAASTDADADDASWSARWPEPRATEENAESPADRFRSALDSGEQESDTSAESTGSSWSWDTPSTAAASAWSATPDEVATESETITPGSSTSPDASADETAASTTEDAPETDPRQHASALLDELRGLIWQIGTPDQPGAGEKNIIRNISRVRGETNDFADLEPVIAAVRDNPRDIDALRDLGEKASRLNDLLESHQRLVSTLEDAISDQ